MKARYVFVTDSGNKNTPFDGLTYVYSEKSPLRETAKVNGTKLIKFREVLKDEITDTERLEWLVENEEWVFHRPEKGFSIGETNRFTSFREAIDFEILKDKK